MIRQCAGQVHKFCQDFVCRYATVVLATPGFGQYTEPEVLVDLLQSDALAARECDIVRAVIRWAEVRAAAAATAALAGAQPLDVADSKKDTEPLDVGDSKDAKRDRGTKRKRDDSMHPLWAVLEPVLCHVRLGLLQPGELSELVDDYPKLFDADRLVVTFAYAVATPAKRVKFDVADERRPRAAPHNKWALRDVKEMFAGTHKLQHATCGLGAGVHTWSIRIDRWDVHDDDDDYEYTRCSLEIGQFSK